MSAREEKLAQAAKRAIGGPARCTLAQLFTTRWGRVGVFRPPRLNLNVLRPGMTPAEAAKALREGDRVLKEAMGGNEWWRVTSIVGSDVNLEKCGGAT